MRAPRLSVLLTLLNLGLLLGVVVGLGLSAARILRRLADEQALARVAFVASAAAQEIARAADGVEGTARLLAERPALVALLAERAEPATLAAFLERFCETTDLTGCAIFRDGKPLAHSGSATLDWEDLLGRHVAGGDYLTSADGALLLAGSDKVRGSADEVVLAVRDPHAGLLEEISQSLDLPVELYSAAGANEGRGPEGALRRRAFRAGQAEAARLGSGGTFRATEVLQSGATPVGLVEVALPVSEVRGSLGRWYRALALIAAAVTGLGAWLSFWLGRRLGRPIETLTRSAERIGFGDLETPVPRVAGAEVGTLGDTMDEMRRRLLELTAELGRRRAEAEAILAGIVEGVFTVDGERRIRYLNPQAAAVLGVTVEAALGRFCGDVLRPRGEGKTRPCDADCPILDARFRGNARAVEHLRPPDGRRLTVVITSSAPVGAQQIQLLRDETEVEAGRRMRDAVVANISHEFRTPLSAQLASIELLRDRVSQIDGAEARGLVLSLERGALRLTRLIDNLLESVRIEAGDDAIRRGRVALDEVIEEAVESTSPLIAQREQALEIDLPYPLPEVAGDAARLVQVFINLLANANKFAPAGTAIRIGGEVEAERVTLWVEDEGPGFPEGAGERIFGRFVRGPAGRAEPEAGGMGLGLWIARSIVERHGGRVQARDDAGTTRVSVMLPRADVEDPGR